MKKSVVIKLIAVCIVFAMLMILSASVYAESGKIPSLFYNDEAWYKDSSAPLVIRNGEYYVPAEIFKMFDYVSVTTPTDDNLLIHNTATGEYMSILFMSQSAAINGKIVEDVGSFRDSGAYYVNAETVCDAIGIKREYYDTDEGNTILRLYDSDRKLSLGTLLKSYEVEEEEYEEPPIGTIRVLKRIYILVKSPSNAPAEYIAKYKLDEYGLNYTMFLDSGADIYELIEANSMGAYGIFTVDNVRSGAAVAGELDKLNNRFSNFTNKNTRITLTTGSKDEDRVLEGLGYIPIKPNFTVNGGSNAEALFADMIAFITKNGACTILLEDCWNSGRIIELISEIDYPYYTTSNIANPN